MKQAEDNYKKAQAIFYSLGNLTLLLLGPRYWMPLVYLIQYYIPQGTEQASEREAGQGPRSLLLDMATPQSPPLLLHVTAGPSFYSSNNTSSFQRHGSGKSSTLYSNLTRTRTPGNEGWGLTILSLLTIAVLKFQLWNLFSATTWNRNVGAVPKFAQW